jgi:hypothetical protein
MDKKDSGKQLKQREADRRKRQAAALKANLKRRKASAEAEDAPDPEETSA